MEDNVFILDQVHEFLILVSKLKNINIQIPEKFLVGAIITKLPSSLHNYKKKLMHTSEDFTLDQIQKHLRIKEKTYIREKNLNGASSSKVNYVDSGKKNNENDKKRKGTWNSSKDNKKDKKPFSEVKDESANAIEQVDTTKINAMVSEMNIGMIQELHMASMTTTTDDWWYDSGATTHVCNNRDLFKTYNETKNGHEVMIGDNHTSKNLVSGFKLCKSGVKAMTELNKVILSKANVFAGKAYACDDIYTYVYLLKSKDQAFETFKIYKAEVENQRGKKIQILRSYRGGEYFSTEFSSYCEPQGLIHQRATPYTPQQNSVAKRKNIVLQDMINVITNEIVTQIPQDISCPDLNSNNKRNMAESSSAPRTSERARKERNLDPNFIDSQAIIFLVEGDNENNVVNKIPVLHNVEDAPKTYKEAITSRNSAFWKEAIDDEIDSLISNNT
ncbi:retrotransposon protein, putative, ty1-copia subclass [Tanacetum coccineum]